MLHYYLKLGESYENNVICNMTGMPNVTLKNMNILASDVRRVRID